MTNDDSHRTLIEDKYQALLDRNPKPDRQQIDDFLKVVKLLNPSMYLPIKEQVYKIHGVLT